MTTMTSNSLFASYETWTGPKNTVWARLEGKKGGYTLVAVGNLDAPTRTIFFQRTRFPATAVKSAQLFVERLPDGWGYGSGGRGMLNALLQL